MTSVLVAVAVVWTSLWASSLLLGGVSRRGDGSPDDVSLYETAYLCGGARRVAEVALLALHQNGRIRIATGRRRVSPLNGEPLDPVEKAALGTVPVKGTTLGIALRATSWHPAVREIADSTARKGLIASRMKIGIWRWAGPGGLIALAVPAFALSGPTPAVACAALALAGGIAQARARDPRRSIRGRRLHRLLQEREHADRLRAVAVTGVPGIGDNALRRAFADPDPPRAEALRERRRGTTRWGYRAIDRSADIRDSMDHEGRQAELRGGDHGGGGDFGGDFGGGGGGGD